MRRGAWIRLSALVVLWALTTWALALFLLVGFTALLIGTPTQTVLLLPSVCANSLALVLGSVATAKRLCVEPAVPATTTIVCARLKLAVLQVLAASPTLLAIDYGVEALPDPWLSVTPALLAEGVSAWNLAGSISGSATARVLASIGFGAVFTAELILYMT